MYKLSYFKATNVTGFYSGMGKKTLEIDMREFLDKDIWVVLGDNGVGKSTLLSLIHPWTTPTDGRTKFILSGKEGVVLREYTGDDGTIIVSKCVYSPKKDGGHTGKYFLTMMKPGGDEVELNPNGNLSSYQSLLYTYFGINKDFLSFASYSSAVSNIVSMTDMERKSAVDTLVPNVKRYEVAYGILNEKYRNLNNLIRNIAQKIVMLRDEDSLEADFDRLTEELRKYTTEREERIKKLSKMEGQLKAISKGEDIDDMITAYRRMVTNLASYDSDIERIQHALRTLYRDLGIETKKDSISFDGIDKVSSQIMKYEKKIAASQSTLLGYENHMAQLKKELNQTERDMDETESVLYSIQMQDINELEETRKAYHEQLANLRYSKQKEKFADMSYDEAVNLSRAIVMMDQMIHALYDEYGEIVSQYFGSTDWDAYAHSSEEAVMSLNATVQTMSANRDQIYRQLIEKENYRKIGAILDQRPKSCTIDTCPFIANALKYSHIVDEIDELNALYKDASIRLEEAESACAMEEKRLAIHTDAQKLVQYLKLYEPQLKQYLGVADIQTVYRAIANGTWNTVLDIMHLKEIASILSEKDLYIQITTQKLPELEHAIELAKVYGTNRDLLMHQLDRLSHTRDLLKQELSEHRMHVDISTTQQKRYSVILEKWKAVSDYIEEYRELVTAQLTTQKQVSEQDEKIQRIKTLLDKCKEQKGLIHELDDLIRARTPKREQVKLDLDAVRRLKLEKLEVERDFTVISVIRSIVAPGKMIRRELIDIYMYDICTIANQLLLNTFDGKLYLKEFVISDKEFTIPYVFNGSEGTDISFASSAQQATIASAISLAILSKLVDKYGIYTTDEQDGPLTPKNKGSFVRILANQMRYVGINQAFIITQEPSYYEPYNTAFIVFPGGELSIKDPDAIYL